jgi:predicted transcriptional regulator
MTDDRSPRLVACATSVAIELRVDLATRLTRSVAGALSASDRLMIEAAIAEAWHRGYALGAIERGDRPSARYR